MNSARDIEETEEIAADALEPVSETTLDEAAAAAIEAADLSN
ncbi:MAG: ATPase, partial [Mesorhizobium sp.]